MGKVAQRIRGIGQYIDEWIDERDQEMIKWCESDPEAYYNYVNNTKGVI